MINLTKLKKLLGLDATDTTKDTPLLFALDNAQDVI